MLIAPTQQPSRPSPTAQRAAQAALLAVAVYSLLVIGILNFAFVPSNSAASRAIVLMADGLILLWIVIGGTLTPVLRKRLVPYLVRLPVDWRVRFVLLSTVMALVEEAITTGMTNCASLLGTTPAEAHITASTNYLDVVLGHSVIVFVPLFVAWAWMLHRWAFSPLEVLLLFGITGSLAEASLSPANGLGGFWVFVYGLMVYLPACTVPQDRPARRPRWWHYLAAVFLPFPFALVALPIVTLLRRWLDMHFLPGTS